MTFKADADSRLLSSAALLSTAYNVPLSETVSDPSPVPIKGHERSMRKYGPEYVQESSKGSLSLGLHSGGYLIPLHL